MNLRQANLNKEQKQAVQTTEGPVLVLSGAGTGKTRVLTARIAYILDSGFALPWQILALTFTNKAAMEMKTRIEAMGDGRWNVSDLWCGTFHSVCLRILRANADVAGLRRDFLVFGEDDQKAVLKTVLTNLSLDTKQYAPAEWVEKLSAIKDKGLGYKPDGLTLKIYNAYNAELARMNAVDFGDIILKVLQLFSSVPDVLAKYQRQFKYVLVDEFQDTNNAQHQFLQMIVGGSGNICCVGDDDQSIYSWRGAEIKHILGFEKNYPGAQIIRLETNYRSTGNILGAANSLIKNNSGRLGKDLRAAPDAGMGEKVRVLTLPMDWDEARIVAEAIEHKDENQDYSDFAVLIRAASLSRLFEEEFASRGIPYRLVGATKFYDRMEVRDTIAYIRLMVHPFDDISFLRVISKPRRGFGDAAIAKLRDFGGSFMSALRAAPLAGAQRKNADEFLAAFDFDWDTMSPSDAAQQLLEKSGYMKMWHESKDPDAKDRIANIKELVGNVISKYDTLHAFLEHAALMMTSDEDDQKMMGIAVSIMTIHAAKGLEFDTVFMPAWEEEIFPNKMAEGEGSIEEERRLAYVAITRARRRAIISNTMSRMVFGERKTNLPSRFIAELDDQFVITQGGVQRKTYSAPTMQSYKPVQRAKPKQTYVGKLVEHKEMGRGVVIEAADDILTIAFRDKGIKKIAKNFVSFVD